MYNIGDMVRVNKDIFNGFGKRKRSAGKVALVMERYKRTSIPSYWVQFFDGSECWIDEENLTILSSCASI